VSPAANVEMRDAFELIYARNVWGHGSGEGSLLLHVQPYMSFLQRFLRERRISSVVDFGCGDWQFSRFLAWDAIDYRGYDIAPSVIAANRRNYQSGRVSFHEMEAGFDQLPAADLLIVKDVFQHWSDETVFSFLPVLKGYSYALITNCVNPAGLTKNVPIADGGFRYLDLRLPPFNMKADEIFSFSNFRPLYRRLFEKPRWVKKVLLIDNRR
jgi:SAM-dependent methyltransferase